MPLPKRMGSEIEYGITVQNDRDFDPISSCVLLVNAYQENRDAQILWDYDQENPLADARGFQRRGREVHAEPAGEHRAQQDAEERRALLRGPRPPGVLDARGHQRSRSDRPRARGGAHASSRQPPRGDVALLPQGQHDADPQEQQRPQGQQLRLPRELPDRAAHAVQGDRRAHHAVPGHAPGLLRRRQGRAARTARQPCDYQISQRADFFETEVALDTMVKRPIINTRDEPHADREKYRRLHVIVGDSNLSEVSIYLRAGVTCDRAGADRGRRDRPRPRDLRSGAGDQGDLARSRAASASAMERGGRHDGGRDPAGVPRDLALRYFARARSIPSPRTC